MHQASPQNIRMMKLLSEARYELSEGHSRKFVAFLSRLLTPDVAARYTAAEALVDPWMLDSEWTVKDVKNQLAAMEQKPAAIPGDYTSKKAWLAKVEELCGAASSEDESEDEGF